MPHIENHKRVWAPPEVVQPIGVVSARNANGGRAQPRTSASYKLVTPGSTVKNPILVTRADGTQEIRAGSAFSSKSASTTKRVRDAYVAQTSAQVQRDHSQYDPAARLALLQRAGNNSDTD